MYFVTHVTLALLVDFRQDLKALFVMNFLIIVSKELSIIDFVLIGSIALNELNYLVNYCKLSLQLLL